MQSSGNAKFFKIIFYLSSGFIFFLAIYTFPKPYRLLTNGSHAKGTIYDTIIAGSDGINYYYKYKFSIPNDTTIFFGQTHSGYPVQVNNINDTIGILYYNANPNVNAKDTWWELLGVEFICLIIGSSFFYGAHSIKGEVENQND